MIISCCCKRSAAEISGSKATLSSSKKNCLRVGTRVHSILEKKTKKHVFLGFPSEGWNRNDFDDSLLTLIYLSKLLRHSGIESAMAATKKKWLNPIILSPRNPGWLGTRVLVPSRKLRESLGFFHISHPKTNKNPNGKIKKISTPKTRVAICFTEKSLAKDQLVPNVRAIHGFGQPMICYNSVDQVLLGATPGIFHPQTVIGKMVAPAPWDGGPL